MDALNLTSLFSKHQSTLYTAYTPQVSAATSNQPNTVSDVPADAVATSAEAPDRTKNQVLSAIQRTLDPAKAHTHRHEHDHDSHDGPEHMARHILNGINKLFSQLLGHGATEEQKTAFFDKVRQALQDGFTAASNSTTAALTPTTTAAPDATVTQAIVAQGVDQLQANASATPPATELSQAQNQTTVLAASVSSKNSSDLQVTTREGDIVTISFNRESSRSIAAYQTVANDATLTGIQKERSNNSTLTISVEGDLNPDELKALSQLMHRIERLADKFFKGNSEALQNKVDQFNFNSDQIAGFSLNLQSEVSKVLVAAQQTSNSVAEPSVAPSSAATDTTTDTATATDLQTIAQTDPAANLLADPQSTVNQAFNNSVAEKLQQFVAVAIVQTELRQFNLTFGANNPANDTAATPPVLTSQTA